MLGGYMQSFLKKLLTKKLFYQIVFCLLGCVIVTPSFAGEYQRVPKLAHGLYGGFGGSWNTIDESFDSTLITSAQRSGEDSYKTNHSRLAPLVQIGYWQPLCQEWLWGVSAQWKYLYYLTPNENASQGQHLPNATFSSINIFGADVDRDFNSQTRVSNELMFLLYVGKQLQQGYTYLGAGPVLLTTSNRVYVSSIHTPNGVGDHLGANAVSNDKIIWGGALQVGYNFYLDETFFLNINYTYLQTGTNQFNNSVNTAILNGFAVPGPTTLNVNRSVRLNIQEVMFSINKVFCF